MIIAALGGSFSIPRTYTGKRESATDVTKYISRYKWTGMGIGALIGLASIKGFMPRNHIRKRPFPQLHHSQYAREFKIIAAALLPGLFVAGGLTTVLVLRAKVGR